MPDVELPQTVFMQYADRYQAIFKQVERGIVTVTATQLVPLAQYQVYWTGPNFARARVAEARATGAGVMQVVSADALEPGIYEIEFVGPMRPQPAAATPAVPAPTPPRLKSSHAEIVRRRGEMVAQDTTYEYEA